MLRVYIAGPLGQGKLCDNVNAATDAFHALRQSGFAPFCPHWSVFAGGCWQEENGDREVMAMAEYNCENTDGVDWLLAELPWVLVSDCVLRLPGPSRGADVEVLVATAKGIPVFTSIDTLKQWAATKEPLR